MNDDGYLKLIADRNDIANYFLGEVHGFDKSGGATAGSTTTDSTDNVDRAKFAYTLHMAKAQLLLAKSDGELSPKEVDWMVGRLLTVGLPREIIDALIQDALKTPENEELDKFAKYMQLHPELNKFRKSFIYESIECAGCDGFDPKEKGAILKLAQAMGLSTADFDVLVDLYYDQELFKAKKIHLLDSAANPLIHAKYRAKILKIATKAKLGLPKVALVTEQRLRTAAAVMASKKSVKTILL
jgi:tellurite resistance protein